MLVFTAVDTFLLVKPFKNEGKPFRQIKRQTKVRIEKRSQPNKSMETPF